MSRINTKALSKLLADIQAICTEEEISGIALCLSRRQGEHITIHHYGMSNMEIIKSGEIMSMIG